MENPWGDWYCEQYLCMCLSDVRAVLQLLAKLRGCHSGAYELVHPGNRYYRYFECSLLLFLGEKNV